MLLVKNLIKSKIDKKFLESVADKTLKNLPVLINRSKQIDIDLVIIGEKRMRSLNRIWRKKDKTTDVLSFGNEQGDLKFKFITPQDNTLYLGQIFICYPVMMKQARQYGYLPREEMSRLLVHGILHLAGYDHERSGKEDKKMMDLQERILGQLRIITK